MRNFRDRVGYIKGELHFKQEAQIWGHNILCIRNCHYKFFNPIALRQAKIVYNFGLSECNRVKVSDENQNIYLHSSDSVSTPVLTCSMPVTFR